MSKRKERVIKITKDNKFHAMGLVVDTFDEAIERCNKKGEGSYFLEWPPIIYRDSNSVRMHETLTFEAGVCSQDVEFLRQCI